MKGIGFLFLIIISVAMAGLVFTGPNLTYDDANYLYYSEQILHGTFNYAQSPYAYGWLLPFTVAASIYLWIGFPTLLAASVPALYEYFFLILLIYFTCIKISSKKVALATSLIAATSAFIVCYSSRILPDMLAGDFVAIAVYLLVYKDDYHLVRAYLSGFFTGLLMFVKLATLGISLPIGISLLVGKRPSQAWYYFLGVACSVLIYLFTIGFNYSIFAKYDAYQIMINDTNLYGNILTALILILPFLLISSSKLYWQIFPLGFLFDLAFVGAYIAYLKKETKYIGWGIVLLLGSAYLLFGTETLTRYTPFIIVSRYFIIFAPIMAILCARLLTGVYDYLHYKYKPLTADAVLASIVVMAVLSQVPMLWYYHTWIPSYVGAPIQNATNSLQSNIIGR